jgi:hypothetical protein
MAEFSEEQLQAYLNDIPLLHSWDDGASWNAGGFSAPMLKSIADVLAILPEGFRVIETGAGNSTLTFLLCGAKSVVSIAPEAALFDRIRQAAADRAIDSGALEAIVAFSEDVLPKLASDATAAGVQYDFALMDGGHAWPTVFVDFCYIMEVLKPGGFLMVDDIQLYSVKQLARLLNESREFSLHTNLYKSLIFQKNTTRKRMGDFGAHPYIMRMSKAEEQAGKAFSLEC